jgi:ArsR family transcriptional regulator
MEQNIEFLAAEEHQVRQVMENMPGEEELIDLSELFRVFGDSSRIKILYALMDHNMCVTDIAQMLQMNQSAVSHQLRILKDAKLVKYKREGKTIFYSLDDDHVKMILNLGMEHISESK